MHASENRKIAEVGCPEILKASFSKALCYSYEDISQSDSMTVAWMGGGHNTGPVLQHLRSSLFWVVSRHRLAVTNVSGPRDCPRMSASESQNVGK